MKDIVETEAKVNEKVLIVGPNVYRARLTSKEQLSTHIDCENCGVEVEKDFTYQRLCNVCKSKSDRKKYQEKEVKEWNGEDFLFDEITDTYFRDADELSDYCYDNEIDPEQMMLVLCEKSTFTQIDWDLFQDDVHEDWEPSDEMKKRFEEFNEFLSNESTRTWFPTKYRVLVTMDDLELKKGGDK